MGLSFYQRRMKALDELGLTVAKKDCMDRHREKINMSIYNSSRWIKLRNKMMAICPTCPDPFNIHNGKVVPAEEVHHITPIKADESMAYDLMNLIPLCRSCHKMADQFDERDPQGQRMALGSIREALG